MGAQIRRLDNDYRRSDHRCIDMVIRLSEMISFDQLVRIMPYAKQRADRFIDPLNAAMSEFDISENGLREAAFLAQIAHESGELRYVEELASGSAYEGRDDLGNLYSGDGVKYKGRGLIQLTGRSNYEACGEALGLDLVGCPELLEEPINACRSAAWYWQSRGLNDLADRHQFLRITKVINGGTNGWNDRLKYYQRALDVIGE